MATLSDNAVIFEVPCFLTSSIRSMLCIGIYVRVTLANSSLSLSWLGSNTKLVFVLFRVNKKEFYKLMAKGPNNA